jgi:hypothetical protein
MQTPLYRRIFCATLLLSALPGLGFVRLAQAQSSCSSDHQPIPTALLERFISADCDACWANSTLAKPSKGQTPIDWIVPSPRGEDAALSSAATLDASFRVQTLNLPWVSSNTSQQTSAVLKVPTQTAVHTPQRASVRVAHGLPFNGYMGASIEFKPSMAQRRNALKPQLTNTERAPDAVAYLVLVETLPAGSEGSSIERNLVRNVLIINWDKHEQLSKSKRNGFKPLFESRPLSLPQGANPDRLRVIGWVQDTQGRVLAAAQSRCKS